jgi:ADP-ribosylation factor GTPase-activating protein 2/3
VYSSGATFICIYTFLPPSLSTIYVHIIIYIIYILGIFLCLDCSSTHRSMGVHTTFVRSVDLDEWTQRQIDAMRLGGNGNARQFFRKHGLTDMHGKIEKKYTSKAAMTYRAELAKQIEAAAVQRGEGIGGTSSSSSDAVTHSGNLMENLALQDQQQQSAANGSSRAPAKTTIAQPKAVLASERTGAKGRLVVTPPNSGGLPMLRKPASKASNSMMLKKKPSGGASSKLRFNKLSVSEGEDTEPGFDDIDPVQKAPAPKPVVNEAPKLVVPPPAPKPAPVPALPPQSSMETGMSKLKAMNSDFFSGF